MHSVRWTTSCWCPVSVRLAERAKETLATYFCVDERREPYGIKFICVVFPKEGCFLLILGVEEIRGILLTKVKGGNFNLHMKLPLPTHSLLYQYRDWCWPVNWFAIGRVPKETVADAAAFAPLKPDKTNTSEKAQVWAIFPLSHTPVVFFQNFTRGPFIIEVNNQQWKKIRGEEGGKWNHQERFNPCPIKAPTPSYQLLWTGCVCSHQINRLMF